MMRSRFTEEQIIAVLREQDAGVATAEATEQRRFGCRRLHVLKRHEGAS